MATATAVVIPLIADEKVLAEALHKQNPSCEHAVLSKYKECEFTARRVFRTGVVKSSTEFMGDLKDMPGVQAIIKDALREAWEDGFDAVTHLNPYDGED